MDGFEVVHHLRESKISTPVIMLTALDDVKNKITGLDSGADDYMTKPFVPEELLARIRALSRRQGEVILEELTFDDLTLNLSSNDLSCKNKSIHLGYKEFEILKILMSNPKILISKETLIGQSLGCRVCCRKQQCGGLYFVLTQEIPLSGFESHDRNRPQSRLPAGK